ncbi:chitinase-3-like protein 1 isoform X2 [Ornithodoros turicata]|uniref:chitinase-3-like protein 1 isoform X2 n=1 Tax=Ornithodoros turicata TaxID=34597 RepID=UPI0031394EAE
MSEKKRSVAPPKTQRSRRASKVEGFDELPKTLQPNLGKDWYRYSPARTPPPSLVSGSNPSYGAATPGIYVRPMFYLPSKPSDQRLASRRASMAYRNIEDDESPERAVPATARTLAPKAPNKVAGEAKRLEEPFVEEPAEVVEELNILPSDATLAGGHTATWGLMIESVGIFLLAAVIAFIVFYLNHLRQDDEDEDTSEAEPASGEQPAFYPYPIITNWNPYIKSVGVIVGGTPEEDQRFRTLFTESTAEAGQARTNFTENARKWCETYNYHRVYLFWSSPVGNITAEVTDKMTRMWTELSQYNISLGLVSDQRDYHLAAYDSGQLSRFLDPFSFLLVPPSFTDQEFQPTVLTYYDGFTINNITGFLSNTTSNKVDTACVLLPSFALESQLSIATATTIEQSQPSSGPGPAGPHTRKAGHLSFYETCDAVSGCLTSNFTYFRWSLCGNTWLSYPAPDLVHNFICEIQRRTGFSCFGVWDTDWDDVADHCGEGRYPMMRAVFHWPLQSCDQCNRSDFAC